MSGHLLTHCGACNHDPCEGSNMACNIVTFFAGNVTRPWYWNGESESEYQVLRRNTLGVKPSAMFIETDQLMYDPATGFWVLKTGEQQADCPQTIRKCECGVWATGGLHSDWCPCAGGDCAQAEPR